MRGLLLKDLYMTWKHFKMFFLICIVFVAVSFIGYDNTFFAELPIMFAAIIPITLLAYDERSEWTEYCGALPYSKAQIVSAKYLIGLIMQAAAMLVTFMSLIVRVYLNRFFHIFSYFNISEAIRSMPVLFIISLILPTVCMPFSLRYGTEKGRMIYYAVIAAVAGLTALIMQVGGSFLKDYPWLIFIYAVAFPVLYVLSWVYSIILYNKKELGK